MASRTRWRWVGSLVLASAVGAGACGRVGDDAAQRPLTIVMGSAPTTFDPHLHDESITYMVLSNVFEGLTAFDKEMQIRPALAVRWENPDDSTWRIHLRPGVRFHNGHVLDANDVVFSIQRAKRLPQSRVGHYVGAVETARALDPLTVELRTNRAYPILLNKLPYLMIVPASTPDTAKQPSGTGPYRIASYDGHSKLVLDRFDQYWGGAPKELQAEILFEVSAAARAAMVKRGAADFAMLIGPEDVPAIEHDDCCRVTARTGLAVSYLGADAKVGPTSDVRVRRAISLAIDRKAIVDSIYRGFATPAGQVITPDVFGYVPDITWTHRDTAEAKRLLAEAGYPNGFRLPLETTQPRAAETRMLAAQLAQVGITLDVAILPWDQLYKRRIAGEVRAYTAAVVCTSGDASDLLDAFMHSRHPGTTWGESNWTNYSNPRVDALVESANATADMHERRQVMQDAIRVTTADLPFIPLWILDRIYVMRRNITWEPRLDGTVKIVDLHR